MEMTPNMWAALRQLHNGLHYIDGRSGDALVRRGCATYRGQGCYNISGDGHVLWTRHEKRREHEREVKRKYPTPEIAFIATCEGMARQGDFKATTEGYRILAKTAQIVASDLAKRIVREKGL